MVAYKVIVRRSAEKELKAIERHLLPSIWSKIKALSSDLDLKAL